MGISSWARRDWEEFVTTRADVEQTLAREALFRFVIGFPMRGEELSSHDLGGLLDAAEVHGEARAELVEQIDFAFGLLAAYDRVIGDGDDDGDELDAGSNVGIGDLVI